MPEFDPTWAFFDRADLAGCMALLNDMREALGAALKSLGYSINTREGTSISCVDMTIPKAAEQVALAHKFIDDIGDALSLYTRAWDQVKAAQ